jgi:hypothetical protein
MRQPGRPLNEQLASLGWHGVVGLALLIFVGAFYFSTIRPAQRQLGDLQQDAERQRLTLPATAKSKPPVDRVAAFYGSFPSPVALPDQLEKIFHVAEAQSLQLEQGDYKVVMDTTGKLTRFQITYPVKGTYPQIRKFVAGALESVPALALSGIQFERKKVGDTTVEARIRFVVFLGRRV